MKVRVFGTLRSVMGGSKEVTVHLSGENTTRKVLDQLLAAYPGLEKKVFDEGEKLPQGINIFVNGRSIRFLDGLSTLLEESDKLALFPPIGGG